MKMEIGGAADGGTLCTLYLENKTERSERKRLQTLHSGLQAVCKYDWWPFLMQMCVRQLFFAKERKYSSFSEAAPMAEIFQSVLYTNLIRTVEEHQQPMQRYLELRKGCWA